MNALLVYPEFPDTFWSFRYALTFIHRKASSPPLGGDACFEELIPFEQEVLAQERPIGCAANRPEMIKTSLKKWLVGQHAQTGGAVVRVGAGNCDRVEVGPQHTGRR